jgi:uncharacterized membrane protein
MAINKSRTSLPHGIGLNAALSEVRFVCIACLILLAMTSIPCIYGYVTAPEDKWFSGIVENVHDTAQYLSWMRESGHQLFIENKLTSEPNEAIFLNLHWWIPGRLAAIAGLSLPQVYQIFRLFAVPFLVVTTYAFCALLFEDLTRRRFAFLLSILTSGGGWIWVVKKQFTGEMDFPRDVHTMLGNAFYTMMSSPHLTFAAALTLLVLFLALQSTRRRQFGFSLGAGLLALFLGLGHVYDLVTVWAVLAVFGLLLTLRDGWSWARFWSLFVVVLLSTPAPLYYGYVSSDANPIWQQALAQYDNLGVFTPDPIHLFILLGLTFLVAWLGFFAGLRSWRAQTDLALFIKGWFIVTLGLIYLPLHFQIMLLTGYQLPMAVLATWGLFDRILPWLQKRLEGGRWRRLLNWERLGRWAPALFLLAVIPTNLYLLAWRVVVLNQHDYPYYLYRDDVAAMRWLDEHTNPDDVVLSSFTIGHYIPGLAGNKAFLSNAVMTMDFNRKREMVNDFFDSTTSDDERQALSHEYGIRYVLYGEAERAVGGHDPEEPLPFAEVFTSSRVKIYAVGE